MSPLATCNKRQLWAGALKTEGTVNASASVPIRSTDRQRWQSMLCYKSFHYQWDKSPSTLDKACFSCLLVLIFSELFTHVGYSVWQPSDHWSSGEYQSEVFSLEIVSPPLLPLPPACSCSWSLCSLGSGGRAEATGPPIRLGRS